MTLIGALAGVLYLSSPPTPATPELHTMVRDPPREIERLGSGTQRLLIPLMTMYAAPDLGVAGFTAPLEVTFTSFADGPSSTVEFQWEVASGTGLPVRFVLEPQRTEYPGSLWAPRSTDGFTHYVMGTCIDPCISEGFSDYTEEPGNQAVVFARWEMDFVIRKMGVSRDVPGSTWIEVDYGFRPLVFGSANIPYEDVTAATESDLVPIGDSVTLFHEPGRTWTYTRSVHDFSQSSDPIRKRLPSFSMDAGSEGVLTVALESEFAWSSADDYRLGLSGTDGVDVTLQFYVDVRFGSLLVRAVP